MAVVGRRGCQFGVRYEVGMPAGLCSVGNQ